MAMAIQKHARPRGLSIVKGKTFNESLTSASLPPPPAAAKAREVMTEHAVSCRGRVLRAINLGVAVAMCVMSPVVPICVPYVKLEANEGREVSIQIVDSERDDGLKADRLQRSGRPKK